MFNGQYRVTMVHLHNTIVDPNPHPSLLNRLFGVDQLTELMWFWCEIELDYLPSAIGKLIYRLDSTSKPGSTVVSLLSFTCFRLDCIHSKPCVTFKLGHLFYILAECLNRFHSLWNYKEKSFLLGIFIRKGGWMCSTRICVWILTSKLCDCGGT